MKVLENVAYELQFSLFLVSSGLYRQAFASLRLVLELALSGILFSSDEFYFRKWKQGLADISWQKITDQDTGIFSKTWLKAFLKVEPDEQDEKDIGKIAELAKKTYRQLSGYVHGGSYTWETGQSHISFNQNEFNLWTSLAENSSRIINYSLLVRFSQDLSLENLQDLEECLLQTIDDIRITRVLLGRPI
jgi:wyosine [tRNA(Phe)-imidazoG37] synthetase (radical SAM superfamily)